jgi:hypothetical protein
MIFIIGIPLLLLLTLGVFLWAGKHTEDIGAGKLYATLFFTLGLAVLIFAFLLMQGS